MDYIFWIWVFLACGFSIAELFSNKFIFLSVAIAAAIGALSEALGAAIWLQVLIFVAAATILLFTLRPFAQRLNGENSSKPKTSGKIIGHCGVVIEDIDADTHVGRVRIQKEEWRAEAPGYGGIPKGKSVEIVKVEGAHVIVKPTKSICGSCTACRTPEIEAALEKI